MGLVRAFLVEDFDDRRSGLLLQELRAGGLVASFFKVTCGDLASLYSIDLLPGMELLPRSSQKQA
ncbi:MAG TPA: hypothetical protein VM715_05980 [Candidatus Acidoferrum sp.]|jgi:hypothetical protein|nr:hypothetical protein [Candidatus Acidoferrum sp.]